MKRHFLDQHSTFCECSKPKKEVENIPFLPSYATCELNPRNFLFFLNNNFIIITYFKCLENFNEYDFKKNIIENVIKNWKLYEYSEVEKSVNVGEDLKKFRIRNKPLKKHIFQINYLYSNNAWGKYAITTTIPYLAALCNQDELEQNYLEAKKYLFDNDLSYLESSLHSLYKANRMYFHDDNIEISKTIEHLIHQIKNTN